MENSTTEDNYEKNTDYHIMSMFYLLARKCKQTPINLPIVDKALYDALQYIMGILKNVRRS